MWKRRFFFRVFEDRKIFFWDLLSFKALEMEQDDIIEVYQEQNVVDAKEGDKTE
jgi:hypothetical protein